MVKEKELNKLIKMIEKVILSYDVYSVKKKNVISNNERFYLEDIFKYRKRRELKESDTFKSKNGYRRYFWIHDIIPRSLLMKRISDIVLKSKLIRISEKKLISCFLIEKNIPVSFFVSDTFVLARTLLKYRNFVRVYLLNNSIPNLFIKNKFFFIKQITLLFDYYYLVITYLDHNNVNSLIRQSHKKSKLKLYIRNVKLALNKHYKSYRYQTGYFLYSISVKKSVIFNIKKILRSLLRNSRLKFSNNFKFNLALGFYFLYLFYIRKKFLKKFKKFKARKSTYLTFLYRVFIWCKIRKKRKKVKRKMAEWFKASYC